MRVLQSIAVVVLLSAYHAALANSEAAAQPTPFAELKAQIDALAARVESLEDSAPNPSVDGRTYCMMVNVVSLRSHLQNGTDTIATIVVRRLVTFDDGLFTDILVSSLQNSQSHVAEVEFGPGMSPVSIGGTYMQSGTQLNVTTSTGSEASWLVSRDGSVIHSNGIDSFGPFPNTLTLGLARSATLIESDTCDPS